MNRASKYIAVALCLLLSGLGITTVHARTVAGRIIDSRNKKGLSNVNISLNGTNVGTVSNADGKFSLYISDEEGASVTFSTVGYTSLSVCADSLALSDNIIRLERQPV